MEMIFDFLIEACFEIFVEGYISLYESFVPTKVLTGKAKKKIKAVFLIIALLLLIGLFMGVVLLLETEGSSVLGRIFITLATLYFFTGITLKLISVARKQK